MNVHLRLTNLLQTQLPRQMFSDTLMLTAHSTNLPRWCYFHPKAKGRKYTYTMYYFWVFGLELKIQIQFVFLH